MSMVQYGLWPNCTNNCDFCLLRDRVYKSVDERLNLLHNIKENIRYIDWKDKFSDGISLLGGEVFYTESNQIKESFLDLIYLITNYIFHKSEDAKLSIVTNGIYDPNILLIPTLDLLAEYGRLDRLDLNFSYDIKYRFHNEESRLTCIKNINLVYDKYNIVPNVQTCLTQYLIDMHLNNEFNIFDFQKDNFPHTVLAFLYPHKINTGKVLDDFFFTRNSLIKFAKWMKANDHEDELMKFIQSVINSSQFKYSGLWNRKDLYGKPKKLFFNKIWSIMKNRLDILTNEGIYQKPTLERKQILTDCGHSQLYRCYSDCDKCMLCDLLKVI